MSAHHRLVSEREAARLLARHGLSLSASQHLLRTGAAGERLPAGGLVLYDGDRVDELVMRTHVRADEFDAACPRGVLIARLPRKKGFHIDAEWGSRRVRGDASPPGST